MIEASAPGKLILLGEYAVLHGAPALAVAVDARVHVRIEGSRGPGSYLVAGQSAPAAFRWPGDGHLGWEHGQPGPEGKPLEAAAGVLSAEGVLPPCTIRTDSEAFYTVDATGRRSKLGLGSSAAVTVALVGALDRCLDGARADPARLLRLCLAAHRRMQGGLGSGLDVASALMGGVVLRDPAAADTDPVPMRPVAWPPQLHLAAIWTGQGASTPALVGRFEAFRRDSPAAFETHLERMVSIARIGVERWSSADIEGLLEVIDSYDEALLRLDADGGIGIDTPAHQRLRALCRDRGLAYKPSGAGGGDFGIALGKDPEALDELRGACLAEGFHVLNAGLCAPGLAVNGTAGRKAG